MSTATLPAFSVIFTDGTETFARAENVKQAREVALSEQRGHGRDNMSVRAVLPLPARIEKNSPTYMRRLCREIRSSFQHGVYFSAERCGFDFNPRISGIMFSLGRIQLKSNAWNGWRGIEATAENHDAFFDGYGRHISASTRK